MKDIVPFFICINFLLVANGQTITGHLSALADRTIKLEGFNGLTSYPISNTMVDSSGHFVLSYDFEDYGVGTLSAGDEAPFMLILSRDYILYNNRKLC